MDLNYYESGYIETGYLVYTADAISTIESFSLMTAQVGVVKEAQSIIESSFAQSCTISHIEGADLFAFTEAQLAAQVDRIRDVNTSVSGVFSTAIDGTRGIYVSAQADSVSLIDIYNTRVRDDEAAIDAAFSLSADGTTINAPIDAEAILNSEFAQTTTADKLSGTSVNFVSELTQVTVIEKITGYDAILLSITSQECYPSLIKETACQLSTEFTQTSEFNRTREFASDENALFSPNIICNPIRNSFAVLDCVASLQTNVIVTKDIGSSINSQFTQITNPTYQKKYWIERITTASGYSISVDISSPLGEDIYVNVGAASNERYIVKLDKYGIKQWQRNYGINEGANLEANSQDYFYSNLKKYDASGNLIWQKCITTNRFPNDTALDFQNNLYFVDNADIGKIDSNGNIVWKKTLNFNGRYINIDNSGNVYVTVLGVFGTSRTEILIKLDSNGNKVWERTLENWSTVSTSGEIDKPHFDSDDNIYIIGRYQTSTTLRSSIYKFNTTGTLVWTRRLSSSTDFIHQLALNKQDNSIFVLIGNGTDGSSFVNITSTGTIRWQKQFAFTDDSSTYNRTIFLGSKVDLNGKALFVTGWKYSSSNQQLSKAFIGRFPLNGTGIVDAPISYSTTSKTLSTVTATIYTTTDVTVSNGTWNLINSTITESSALLTLTQSVYPINNGGEYEYNLINMQEAFSLNVSGIKSGSLSANLQAFNTASIIASISNIASVDFNATTSLTAISNRIQYTSSSQNVIASLVSNVERIVTINAQIVSSVSIQAISERIQQASVFLDATGSQLTVNGRIRADVADLDVIATLNSTASKFNGATISLDSTATQTADVIRIKPLAANLTDAFNFVATCISDIEAQATIESTTSAEINASRIRDVDAEFTAFYTELTVNTRTRDEVANLTSTFNINAIINLTSENTVNASSQASLNAIAVRAKGLSSAQELTSTLSATATRTASLVSQQAATTNESIEYIRYRNFDATFTAFYTELTVNSRIRAEVADLDCEFTIYAKGNVQGANASDMESTVSITAQAARTRNVVSNQEVISSIIAATGPVYRTTVDLDAVISQTSEVDKTTDVVINLQAFNTQVTANARTRNEVASLVTTSTMAITAVRAKGLVAPLTAQTTETAIATRLKPLVSAMNAITAITLVGGKSVQAQANLQAYFTPVINTNIIHITAELTYVIPAELSEWIIGVESRDWTISQETREYTI